MLVVKQATVRIRKIGIGMSSMSTYKTTPGGGSMSLGTIRNRTEIFLKYRKQSQSLNRPFRQLPGHERDDDGSLETARLVASALQSTTHDESATVSGDLESGWKNVSILPKYVVFKEEISRDMEDIRRRMTELKSLHGKASLSSFEDSREDEIAVEIATQQITKLFRKIEERLRDFGSLTNVPEEVDQKVQKNVQRTLARDLQQLSVQFRKQQKVYLQRIRDKHSDGMTLTEHRDSIRLGASGDGSALLGYDPGFSDVQLQEADSMAAVIHERDKEVQNVLKSIGELGQIMKDLSVLVIDQGTILDRIDYNLEQTTTRVEQGVRQLRRAEKAQRRGAMASCVMILIVAVVAMLIVVLFKAAFI